MKQNLHLRAKRVLYSFGQHPAAISDFIFPVLSLLNIDISVVCKRGYTKSAEKGMPVLYTSANYKKYKKEFDKEFKEYTVEELEKEKNLIRIDIPYHQMFGEPWKADRIEYWGDLDFIVFLGKDFKSYFKMENWQRCAAVEAKGRTFEEMIVNLGQDFFKRFGKWESEDFLTKTEKENHRKHLPFLNRPTNDGRAYALVENPKYKDVNPAEINRRWANWFLTTDYCKKQWKETIQRVVAGETTI